MSDYSPVSSPNDGAALAALLTPPTIWQKQVEHFIENTDFYAPVEGSGANSIIRAKSDLTAGMGQKLKIRVESGFSNEPHFGDETFANDVDFEEALFSEYDLTIDVLRHATSFTERAEEIVGLRNEIRDGVPRKLGEWLGRRKTEELDMMFTNLIPDDNRFYAGIGKTSATLLTADGLGFNTIMNVAASMQTLGGQTGKLGTFSRDKSVAEGFAIIGCSDACTILRQDSTYVDYQKSAGIRGDMNPLFRGHVSMIDGHAVVDRRIIDSDAEGAIGSPMNPKAQLGVAITADTTAFDIKGGGNATSAAKTQKKFFKYFAGYAYKFATGSTFSPASATRYLLIVNPPNAATDPNKIGMYAYTTGNDGNKITITARLGSAASGVRVTTLGDVTWDTGVWSGKHTAVHGLGSLIIPCNAKGVPLGRSFLLGRAAALRGYGKHRAKRDTELAEGGFLQRTYLRSYFGQQLRYDRAGRVPGVAVIEHSLAYPYLPLPVVTA